MKNINRKDIKNLHTRDFNNINGFLEFLRTNPENKVFQSRILGSKDNDYEFRGTHSLNEAIELMNNGWKAETTKLKSELGKLKVENKTMTKSIYDVAGYQASVPRYLQGIPTSMINSKRIVQKNKIVNIYKSISYPGNVKKEDIEKDCLEVLNYSNQLEANGQRTNIYIIVGLCTSYNQGCDFIGEKDSKTVFTIKIKSSSERMNLSKISFPLVHPSMLRRLIFRIIEVDPEIKDQRFVRGYGYPLNDRQIKSVIGEDGIYFGTDKFI